MKRLFDIFFSLIFFLLTLPLLLISSICILIIDFQNPFFIQERSGFSGKKFNVLKLQTMKFKNKTKKVSKLGKILRLTKIDELPQLINVIINDMSIIGPRPLFFEFNEYYKKKHKLRINIKPGITGLAQVKVNDSTDWNKKFNFDYIYVKKMSCSLDFYILFKTLKIVTKSIFIKKARALESIDYKKSFYNTYCK